jgi:putative membrane protein insertion efficiency factor
MHDLFSTERVEGNTSGNHGDDSYRQLRTPQSRQAPAAGSFPAESPERSRWMGYRFEPAPGSGRSLVRFTRSGVAAFISSRVSTRTLAPESAPRRDGPQKGGNGQARLIGKSTALALIRFYKACLSPLVPSSCRFHPTCSAYAYEAIERFGLWRGTRLTFGRLLRCRPFGGQGYDPVS